MANFDLSKVSQSVINFVNEVKNADGDPTNKLSGKELSKIGDYLAGNKELNDNDKKYLMNEIDQNLLDSNVEHKDRSFGKIAKGILEDLTKLAGANRNDTEGEHISLIQGPEAGIAAMKTNQITKLGNKSYEELINFSQKLEEAKKDPSKFDSELQEYLTILDYGELKHMLSWFIDSKKPKPEPIDSAPEELKQVSGRGSKLNEEELKLEHKEQNND